MKHLDWEDIRFLGAVARHKSVRATAKHLGVHHSTVSRRIESLEFAAETKLFSRTPEGFVLTEAGSLLADTALQLEEKISQTQRLISGGDKALSGNINISMPEPIAVNIFAKHLREFSAQFPDINVSINSSYSMADLARQQADVVIRLSNSPDENLFGKRLFSNHSSAYVAKDKLDSFKEHNWSNCQWLAWNEKHFIDKDWLQESGLPNMKIRGYFPELNMQMALAAQGYGIAFLPCFLGDEHPNLVRATKTATFKDREIWVLTHSDLRDSIKIRSFMTFAERVLIAYRNNIIGNTLIPNKASAA